MVKKVNYGLLFVCIVSLAIIGCGSLLDRVTPANPPKLALNYVGKDPNLQWFSLYKARELQNDITVKYRVTQTQLMRIAEDDKYAYLDAKNLIESSIKEAEGLQNIVVGSESQPFSLLGILAGATGGLSIGGALIKRKGDSSPDEVQAKIADAQNKTWDECEAYLTNKGLLKPTA
jgi:hypothetical protein